MFEYPLLKQAMKRRSIFELLVLLNKIRDKRIKCGWYRQPKYGAIEQVAITVLYEETKLPPIYFY